MKLRQAVTILKKNILLVILILFFSYLFIYRFDYPTLGSWDEAWYASISREMVKSGDLLHSNWNGKPFYDHPPMGFWIVALSYKIFGISEFSTRLPSVLLGIITIILVYLTGIQLFKKKAIGFAAALILGTSVWYIIRVRSGNLDSPFMFFYILSIYLALKSVKDMRLFPLVGLALGSLMMTKTLIGASVVPVIAVIMIPQILNIKKSIGWFLAGVISFLVVVGPWYYIHYQTYPDFIKHHFLNIGTRNKTAESYFQLNYELPLFYLHMGVRKWYYLWSLSMVYLIIAFRFLKRNVFIIVFWNAIVLYPFLTTDQTHIWHLIPVYLPLSLITAFGLWSLGNNIVKVIKKLPIPAAKRLVEKVAHEQLITVVYLLGILTIAAMQFKIFYPEVFPASRYTPDDVDISQKVAKYDQKIYLDDDYLPMAVYYSGRFMKQMSNEPEERKTLVNLFQSKAQNFVVITRIWAVNNLKDNNLEYRVLEENASFVILTRP